MKFCQKCGKEITDEALFCGSCGTAVGNNIAIEENDLQVTSEIENDEGTETIKEEVTPIVVEAPHVKKKFVFSKLTVIIIAAVLVVCVGVGAIIAKNISLNKYEEKLSNAYSNMIYGAEQAEKYATLQSKVWRNCIYENKSSETDKYTKDEYGWFYDDFNDALSKFYEGESLTYSIVDLNVLSTNTYMSELKDCPKQFEEEYKALKELYVAYSDMTELVIGSSSYSCTSYNDALNEAKSNYKTALSSTRLLLE